MFYNIFQNWYYLEQMTQADILYFFPQLCRNQESIFNSENCRHITLLGSRTGDLRMVDGIKWVGFQQADEDAVSDKINIK